MSPFSQYHQIDLLTLYCMNYLDFYGTSFVLLSIENAMQSRINKWKNVHIGAYFAHLSIDYHLANIARLDHDMLEMSLRFLRGCKMFYFLKVGKGLSYNKKESRCLNHGGSHTIAFNIADNIIRWVTSFLTDMNEFVKIREEWSFTRSIVQGSGIGWLCLLFK